MDAVNVQVSLGRPSFSHAFTVSLAQILFRWNSSDVLRIVTRYLDSRTRGLWEVVKS